MPGLNKENLELLLSDACEIGEEAFLVNFEELQRRSIKRREQGEPLKVVVFGCMPEVIPSVYDNRYIRYDFAGSGLKTTVDYKADRFEELQSLLGKKLGIQTCMTCLIADTEARVKSDGLLRPVTKEEVGVKALKVVKRVAKRFPGEVLLRSDLLPVASRTYRSLFLDTFKEIFNEVLSDDLFRNPRVVSRMNELTSLGCDSDVALNRSIRDLALMDSEYAMEGVWLSEQCKFDALVIADNYPISSYKRTFRLLPESNFPVIFLGPYEVLE